MGKNKHEKAQEKNTQVFLFSKRNYQIMALGIIIIAIGFILMAGGGSDNPEVFNDAIYNFRRIRLAPTIVLIGFAVEVFAILYKEKH
jgi:hypothetical protein